MLIDCGVGVEATNKSGYIQMEDMSDVVLEENSVARKWLFVAGTEEQIVNTEVKTQERNKIHN